MSDPGGALVDMDAMTEGKTDSPLFKLRAIPLPITHGDFWFSERRLEVSRNSTALDTTMAEAVSRRIAETVEATTIGTQAAEIDSANVGTPAELGLASSRNSCSIRPVAQIRACFTLSKSRV